MKSAFCHPRSGGGAHKVGGADGINSLPDFVDCKSVGKKPESV